MTAYRLLTSTVIGAGAGFPVDLSKAPWWAVEVDAVVNTTAATVAAGTNANVNTTTGNLVSTAHGFFTGQVVQLTTTGTLPTGFSLATNYYVFVIDANDIQLFSSLATALAAQTAYNKGIAPPTTTGLVIPSTSGSSSSTMTLTPTAVSNCSYKLQKSNSYHPTSNPNATWINVATGETHDVVTNTITTTGSTMASAFDASYEWGQVLFAISAGTVQVNVWASVKRVV